MDKHPVMTPDHVPAVWPAPTACACVTPSPQVRAERKGAARTYCTNCGLPIRIDFERR